MADASQQAGPIVTLRTDMEISNPAITPTIFPAGSTTSVTAASEEPDQTTLSAVSSQTNTTPATLPSESSTSSQSALTSSSVSSCPSLCPSLRFDPASTTATSMVPIAVENSSKVNGLIAGLVVFAMLFLVMASMLIWSIRRKRGSYYKEPDSPYSAEGKPSMDPSGMENTIASLETQLHEKDSQLRERQMLMISKGQSISRTQTINKLALSDDQIRDRFLTLQKAIGDWVALQFGTAKFAPSPISDVVKTVERTFPQHDTLLKDNTMVKIVLEGLVSDMICQAFASGQLLGNEAFWELKQAILSKIPAAEANEWRAMTSRLLGKIPSYQSDRTEVVEDLGEMIDAACSELTKTRPKDERRKSLEQVVDFAASVALDMARQRALFKVEKPVGTMFSAETMSLPGDQQDATGKQIRAILFPMVTKCGGETSIGWDRSRVVVKAKVLL